MYKLVLIDIFNLLMIYDLLLMNITIFLPAKHPLFTVYYLILNFSTSLSQLINQIFLF